MPPGPVGAQRKPAWRKRGAPCAMRSTSTALQAAPRTTRSPRPTLPEAHRAHILRLLALTLSIMLLQSACGDRRDAPPPNFVLISLDTLRPDTLGCYGNAKALTPTLDAVCKDGTVFDRAVANAPWTLPSHVSLLTGRYPRNHGVKNVGKQVPDDVPMLQEILAEAGYATAAIIGSPKLGPRYGLDRGFQQGVEHPPGAGRAAPLQVEQAIRWMSAQQREGRPFFLFLHNFDAHTDYDPADTTRERLVSPYRGDQRGAGAQLLALREANGHLAPPDIQFLRQLYDAGVHDLDADLAALFAFLSDPAVADHTVVFITSDHGEEFYEHGSVLHGVTMHRETLQVPMIAWGRGIPAGQRVSELVQLSDLLPTVLDLSGLPAAPRVDGTSVAPAFAGERLPRRYAFAEADWRGETLDTFRMVRDEGSKLIFNRVTGEVSLFDLESDPEERNDIAADAPERVARMMEPLRRYLSNERVAPDRPPLTPAEIETLRALGYIE